MSRQIQYPKALQPGDVIGITAPSSGVEPSLHSMLHEARQSMERAGFHVVEGETIWKNFKCVSAPRTQRAEELQQFLVRPDIHAIIPPWGGEFLMDILPLLDWEMLKEQQPKWVLGYSDISTFTLVYTLLTGHATAHGPNYIDLRSNPLDETSARWLDVLRTEPHQTVEQQTSTFYQSAWNFDLPGLQLDTPTKWKILGQEQNPTAEAKVSGRLLGGCLDTLSILVGTRYAPVAEFSEKYCHDSGILWYLESCDFDAAGMYRSLWQMKECGWFEHAKGILFGRPNNYRDTGDFGMQDALHAVFDELGIPVIYDIDCGHVPPQMTFVNGAYADVFAASGHGQMRMSFI
ncbi:LD-carboxypeptidase [Paenibacillus selenitireducens]|uniref:LD-carboxypeptidase n=1 Tax=Paenibacillus selenitireducens TaxID=1324314 RepID=A0A1T2X8I9_9BACL|nr:S66 peptidase family protein [Paenibacillus selenitireducens]OPA76184.1 LD-carboxypeptidase [Paenibacillus selenitireducens]